MDGIAIMIIRLSESEVSTKSKAKTANFIHKLNLVEKKWKRGASGFGAAH